jgi:hypothetical protein
MQRMQILKDIVERTHEALEEEISEIRHDPNLRIKDTRR